MSIARRIRLVGWSSGDRMVLAVGIYAAILWVVVMVSVSVSVLTREAPEACTINEPRKANLPLIPEDFRRVY